MKVYKFKPRSNEWLKARSTNITATEVATLFGLDQYKTANKVLKDKLNPPALKDNVYMRAGRLFEGAVFIALQEHGIDAKPADYDHTVFIVDEEHRVAASLDGKCMHNDSKYIVEAKTTRIDKFKSWYEQPPLEYMLQVHTQLTVSGIDSGILACLGLDYPDYPLIAYQVYSDDTISNLIKQEAKRFWDCHAEGKAFTINKEHKAYILDNIYSTAHLIIQ